MKSQLARSLLSFRTNQSARGGWCLFIPYKSGRFTTIVFSRYDLIRTLGDDSFRSFQNNHGVLYSMPVSVCIFSTIWRLSQQIISNIPFLSSILDVPSCLLPNPLQFINISPSALL